jgi:protein-disulfide isomerase
VKGKDIFLNESEAVAYLKANYQLKNATYVLFTPSSIIAG